MVDPFVQRSELEANVGRIPKEWTADVAGIEFPDGPYHDRTKNRACVEGDVVVQELTEFGQRIAPEIVFVEMPRVGWALDQGETFMSMKSGWWAARIPATASGEILEVNAELSGNRSWSTGQRAMKVGCQGRNERTC